MDESQTIKQSIDQNFVNSLEYGTFELPNFTWSKKQDYWEMAENRTNLETIFYTTNFDSKEDFEYFLPNLIQKNLNLLTITFIISGKCEFNQNPLIEALKYHKTLNTLEIRDEGDNNFSNFINNILDSFQNIEILNLIIKSQEISNSLTNLEKLKVKNLNLYEARIKSEYFKNSFPEIKCLLLNNTFEGQDIYNFIECFPKLKKLKLCYEHIELNISKLNHCLKNIPLKSLEIYEITRMSNITDFKEILERLESLEILDIEDLKTYPIFEHLNPHLKKLRIFSCSINFEGMDNFLINTQDLIELSLDLRDLDISLLNKGLSKNNSLKSLMVHSVKNNYIDLFKGLMMNDSITDLSLGNRYISDNDCSKIKDYLLKNQSLTELELFNNNIKSQGLFEIIQGTKNHSSLKSLSFTLNHFGNEGCFVIKEFLCSNHSVQVLDLSFCGFNKIGLNYIGEGLLKDRSLTKIILKSMTNVEDSFTDNLFYNTTLLEVIPEFNNQNLKNILKRNKNYTKTLKVYNQRNLDVLFNFQ